MRKVILAIIIGVIALYFASQGYAQKSVASPCNRINEDMIRVYDDKVVIDLKNAKWSYFTPTGSMLPSINENSNAIEITPESEKDVCVGDIIAFRYSQKSISHRVMEKGTDEQGVYFITKGDNLESNDPFKVRFSQIESVIVAIIY